MRSLTLKKKPLKNNSSLMFIKTAGLSFLTCDNEYLIFLNDLNEFLQVKLKWLGLKIIRKLVSEIARKKECNVKKTLESAKSVSIIVLNRKD